MSVSRSIHYTWIHVIRNWWYTELSIYLKRTVIRLAVKPMERRLRGILCEGTRPFPDFSLKISDNLWWRLKSSRSSSKPLLLPQVHTEETTWVPTLLSPCNKTGEASSPVVCVDEVVLHQHLVHSHHQDGVDVILGANAGYRRELGRLVLVNRQKTSIWEVFLQKLQTTNDSAYKLFFKEGQ